jgi:hypothetical protein
MPLPTLTLAPAKPLLGLLIPAALGAGLGLSMIAFHREKPAPPKPTATPVRTLKLEAYTPDIPKAPVQGPKLDTAVQRPVQLAQAEPAERTAPPVHVVAPKPVTAPAAAPRPPRAYASNQPVYDPRRRYFERVEDDASPPPARWSRYAYNDPPPPPPSVDGRYVEAPGYTGYAPGDPRAPAPPQASGFRLNAQMCRRAARMADPLAQTQECSAILQASRAQQEACKRAFDIGDDRIAMSPECRQAAMGR